MSLSDQDEAMIRTEFERGKEFIFAWDDGIEPCVKKAMNQLGSYLARLDPALSYEGTDKKVVWRKSCWVASNGVSKPLLDSVAQISKFDGDLKDGLEGLQALRDDQLRTSLHYLKSNLDESLVATAQALNIPSDMLERCTTRYRIIKYTAHTGNNGGIGIHPDGNLLSALITNGAGLGVYDFDGTFRRPISNGTILMGGSTLHRWSKGLYLPTFHDVEIGPNQEKDSIVAFLNFPDMVHIPRNLVGSGDLEDFFHDIKRIKEDDKSTTGELAHLWDIIISRHHLPITASA